MDDRLFWAQAAAPAAGISQVLLRAWRLRGFLPAMGKAEGGHGRATYTRADICALRVVRNLVDIGQPTETAAHIALCQKLRTVFAAADHDLHVSFGDETEEIVPKFDWTDAHYHHWVSIGFDVEGRPLVFSARSGNPFLGPVSAGQWDAPLILIDAAEVWRGVTARLQEIEAAADMPIGPTT